MSGHVHATPGLLKALAKSPGSRTCTCGFTVPKYPGRYPKSCPLCKTPAAAADAGDAKPPEKGGTA